MQLVKQAILPRVHGLALKTTVAAVCMSNVHSLQKYVVRLRSPGSCHQDIVFFVWTHHIDSFTYSIFFGVFNRKFIRRYQGADSMIFQ